MQQDTRRLVAAAVVLLLGAALTHAARGLRPRDAVYQVDFASVPMTIGPYRARKLPVDEGIFSYLAAQAMEQRVYEGKGRQLLVSLIYGTDWRSIHAPTSCYPAQGWQVISSRTLRIAAPAGCPHPEPISARAVCATKGDEREVALFVYARPGGTTADWTTHTAKVMLGPRGAGGMILIFRSRPTGNNMDEELKPLEELLVAAYPRAVAFWYEGGQPQAPRRSDRAAKGQEDAATRLTSSSATDEARG